MEQASVKLMGDRSEVVGYDRAGLPLYIRTGELSRFPDMQAPCHWHEDIELIFALSGRMRYYINGEEILLEPGDSVIVNSRQMHFGFDFRREECRYNCILFHPSLLSGGRLLERDFVTPILSAQHPAYWHFRAGTEEGDAAASCARGIAALKEAGRGAYELEAVGRLHELWAVLWRSAQLLSFSDRSSRDPDIEIQKEMAAYICRHYGERLLLEDIAAAGHVSRSKCCQIFHRFTGQTPIGYLNAYRLKLGREMLLETERSVTEIALACGFRHLSYFSRSFLRAYGCTPGACRSREVNYGNHIDKLPLSVYN